MGQLFNRIKRIVQAETNPRTKANEAFIEDGDDGLKKIIDELNESKQRKNEYTKEKSGSDNNYSVSDACALLGVSVNAEFEEIRIAYKKKIAEYHPDKVAHLGEELQKMAEIKTKDINYAYSYLKKVKS